MSCCGGVNGVTGCQGIYDRMTDPCYQKMCHEQRRMIYGGLQMHSIPCCPNKFCCIPTAIPTNPPYLECCRRVPSCCQPDPRCGPSCGPPRRPCGPPSPCCGQSSGACGQTCGPCPPPCCGPCGPCRPAIINFRQPTCVTPLPPKDDCCPMFCWPDPPQIDTCGSSSCPPMEREIQYLTICPEGAGCSPQGMVNVGAVGGCCNQ